MQPTLTHVWFDAGVPKMVNKKQVCRMRFSIAENACIEVGARGRNPHGISRDMLSLGMGCDLAGMENYSVAAVAGIVPGGDQIL